MGRVGAFSFFFTFLGGSGRWVGKWFIVMWDMFYDQIKYGVMCLCMYYSFEVFVH
jgi:hypothetical protein